MNDNLKLPLDNIEVVDDDLMFVLGGAGSTVVVPEVGYGCGCGCGSGVGCGCGSGAGCGCGCNCGNISPSPIPNTGI